MEWKNLFSEIIEQRGKKYFEEGRVTGLEKKATGYIAKVLGTAKYTVYINANDEGIKSMRCNCPQAQDGKKCKHMAAVLYAIEENDMELQVAPSPASKKTKENLFAQNEDYTYFNMKKIANSCTMKQKNLEKAKKMLANRNLTLDRIDIYPNRNGYTGDYDKYAYAVGTYQEQKKRGEVRLSFDRENLFRVHCDVPQFYQSFDKTYYSSYSEYRYRKEDLTAPVIALLLLVQEYIKKYNPGDATTQNSLNMMKIFQQAGVREQKRVQENREIITLEPRVEWYGGEKIKVSFRIAKDKSYVVKNLTELVTSYSEMGNMKLGTKNFVDFATEDFTEEAVKYYHFIETIVKNEASRIEKYKYSNTYYDMGEEIKGSIDLYGERMDAFYELIKDKNVEFQNKTMAETKKGVLVCKEKKVELNLKIEEKRYENQFDGIILSGKIPNFILGLKDKYYISDDHLYRLEEESAKKIEKWMILSSDNDIHFEIGRKYLSEFYYNTLPELKKTAQIKVVNEQQEKKIISHLLPRAEFIFFLDIDGKKITCLAKALYGEKEFLLTEEYSGTREEQIRDRKREDRVIKKIVQYFPETDQKEGYFYCEKDEDKTYELLANGIDELLELGIVNSTQNFKNLKIRKKMKLSMKVSMESGLLNLNVQSDDIDKEELIGILNGYRKKKKYYRLRSGDFIELQDENIQLLSEMLDTMQISLKEFVKDKMQLPAYRALYLEKVLEEGESVYTERDKHFKRMIKEFKTVRDSDFEIPESLQKTMRNYQEIGYRWLRTLESYHFGGILADDMGLGKTLQMIAVLLDAKKEGRLSTALIITPASLVYNWEAEFQKFAPSLVVGTVTGTQQDRKRKINEHTNYDVLITSYDLLKRDIAEYGDIKFSHQVIDEAQFIKNYNTAAAKSVKIIQSNARFALTGTPIENRLSELWSIFDFLMPGFLYGYDKFKKEFEIPIMKRHEEEKSLSLKKMVSPFIMRRLKKDVLKDLPDKLEEICYAKMEDAQRKMYDGQVLHMQEILRNQSEENFMKNKFKIFAEITKLRQICCDPELLFDNSQVESAKRTACIELLQRAIEGGHKILLFSQFTSMLELLEKDLNDQEISYYKITGATPKEKRMDMVKEFNEGDVPVFLISLKAGGTGLNLTGADVVIHYDPWWNLAVQNQASDRAHRIGQKNKVTVYKLITKDTIEEKIVKLQESKKDLADEILNGENGTIGQMTKEEILELL